ncbi:BA75_01012T0 [Komagataella pastoris]|uniref:BA75_01012T0 n=1 Tax=Komagataella pastoris TaxID=4922 RepID=A0A1B2J6A2_PICPA|nr:BA75_01012T0 [Komagataella pastoris]
MWRHSRRLAIFRRFYSYHRRKENVWESRLFMASIASVIAGSVSWYYFWPHHTFSTPVAKILRKGLKAESDKGDFDYKSALESYKMGLRQAKEENIPEWSNEYTGIQLKIAQMMEYLHDYGSALLMYKQINSAYLTFLKSDLAEDDAYPELSKPYIILKNLRVSVKIARVLERSNQTENALKVLKHAMMLCSNYAIAKSAKAQGKDLKGVKLVIENNRILVNNNEEIKVERNRENWSPFTFEFFNASDYYVSLCTAYGNLEEAIRERQRGLLFMVLAQVPGGDILLSQYNLGSLLYMKAEQLESLELKYRKDLPRRQEKLERTVTTKNNYLSAATECFETVREMATSLDQKQKKGSTNAVRTSGINENNSIKSKVLWFQVDQTTDDSIALSTYALGVIKLHGGMYKEAEDLLKETMRRASRTNYTELIQETQRELGKLEQERKYGPKLVSASK